MKGTRRGMAMLPIFNANQERARDLVEKDSGVWIELLREQPLEGMELAVFGSTNNPAHDGTTVFTMQPQRGYLLYGENGNSIIIKLYHPSGLYDVKETWCARIYEYIEGQGTEITILYKSDYTKEELEILNYKWCSPILMPREAVRSRVKIDTTVEQKDDGLWYEIYNWTEEMVKWHLHNKMLHSFEGRSSNNGTD